MDPLSSVCRASEDQHDRTWNVLQQRWEGMLEIYDMLKAIDWSGKVDIDENVKPYDEQFKIDFESL